MAVMVVGRECRARRSGRVRRRGRVGVVFVRAEDGGKPTTLGPGEGTVLVAGASGGVGQLVTAKLLDRGYSVRAMVRELGPSRELLGSDASNLEVVEVDGKNLAATRKALEGIAAVICTTGTTAFPSKRWGANGDNKPTTTGLVLENLVAAAPKDLRRIMMVSSIGVERSSSFPFLVLNVFGALDGKVVGEKAVQQSGLPYTILRPCRLTDGPYTSYDLNTLLQATRGNRNDVFFRKGDTFSQEETSRIVLAEALVQALLIPGTTNQTLSMSSVAGEGPGEDLAKWTTAFNEAI